MLNFVVQFKQNIKNIPVYRDREKFYYNGYKENLYLFLLRTRTADKLDIHPL